ncbi:MAG: hypothetical protein ABF727_09790 [Gluconobacter oxydans]
MPPPFSFALLRLSIVAGAFMPLAGQAQSIEVANGLPEVPHEVFPEVGIPKFTVPAGKVIQLGGPAASSATTPATVTGQASPAMDALYSASWGYEAAQNAEAVGITADALAATCRIESDCQNISAVAGKSGITGAFQMMQSTYSASMREALQAHPELAEQTVDVDGQHTPAVQAIAAAQYIKDGATAMTRAGISNPTVLDVRGYYNFGPGGGAALAKADDADTVYSTLAQSGFSQSALTKNGIRPGETVGEWKQGVAAKIGSSASAPVLKS